MDLRPNRHAGRACTARADAAGDAGGRPGLTATLGPEAVCDTFCRERREGG
jgi:hypothetical protein